MNNVGKAKLTIGGTITNRIMTEFVPRAPNVFLTNEQEEKQRQANAELGAKSQARREQEGEITPAPSILGRDKQPFEIQAKLERGRGVVLPTNPPLTTAQREIEAIGRAPSILLANVNEPKSETKTPTMHHNVRTQLCFQNSVINGSGDE